MEMKMLNPWNWFKHEESTPEKKEVIPVKQGEYSSEQHPLTNMMQLHRQIDRLFDDAFRGFPSVATSNLWQRMMSDDFMPAFRARLNVASDDQQYTVTLEAPGLEQKDITLELRDRALLIKGNKKQEQEEKDKHYYRIECSYGSFERVLAIPDDADAEAIRANMKNGVLTISIPRREVPAADARKIEIN